MDKRVASQFGSNIARGFVAAGGTLIALAHRNKNKGADGASQFMAGPLTAHKGWRRLPLYHRQNRRGQGLWRRALHS